jgi:hypothetical protein
MMYSVIPANVILENPFEYKPSEVPTMTWKGLQVTVENGCIMHMLSSNPFDFLNIGPCSRI